MKKTNSTQTIILILLFSGLILLPFFFYFTGFKVDTENFENREMAKMPRMPVINATSAVESYGNFSFFINDFNRYVNDNFPFRNVLFHLFRDIKMKLFMISPLPDKVVLGEDGWYFLGDSSGSVIRESYGIKVFSDQELDDCLENILDYDSFLNKNGIKFYFSVAPNKSSVYGHFLPIIKSRQATKLERIKLELAKRSFTVIDLKEDFVSMPHVRLYHKTNSHWNEVGAFLGYQSVMERIQVDFPSVSRLNMNDFIIDTTITVQEDLTKMLHMNVNEAHINLSPIHAGNAFEGESKAVVAKISGKDVKFRTQRFFCKGKPLKLLVFCDSFFTVMIPFFVESFGETVIIDSRMNKDVITAEKPDMVLVETAERDLDIFIDLD